LNKFSNFFFNTDEAIDMQNKNSRTT